MGFSQPFDEAHSIQTYIEKNKTSGNDDGAPSPLHAGASDGGGLTPPVSDLVPRRTKIHVRTSSLTRKYPPQT